MGTKLRRGFKSEAHQIARDVRAELGIRRYDPLDVWALAEALAIPVIPLSDYMTEVPEAVLHFHRHEESAFSAVTVFHGPGRVIVHNDRHAPTRQASNLAHELAHALLFHEPHPALDGTGCRFWDAVMEKEANWLGGALLVSEEAALRVARLGWGLERAAAAYGVSPQMMRFRLNVTGARTRVRRGQRA